MSMTTTPTEYTTKGQNIMRGIWAQAKHNADMIDTINALNSTPKEAEFVEVKVLGTAPRLRFEAAGWTLVRDNQFDGGVYRAWVRESILRMPRAQVEAIVAREVGF